MRTSYVLGFIIKRSHVAIWKWIQKYSFVLDSDVGKHDVNSIFIDETEINFSGKLLVAYEPQLKAFLRKFVKKYGRKAIYTDGALWYVDACRWAVVVHVVYEQSLKNLMERMNKYIKDRTKAFDDLFPCRRPKFERVKNWFKAFRFFYNYVFTNEEIGSAPLSNDQLSEWIKPILLIASMR